MKNNPVIGILQNFTINNWVDWIDNILLFDVAPPINFIKQNSDVIIDMMDFLFAHNIDTVKYEEALVRNISIYKLKDNSNCTGYVIRMIDALQIKKMQESYELLIEILTNEQYCIRKNIDDWGTKVLQNLTFYGILSNRQQNIVKECCYNYISNIEKDNPAFIQNFISFIRKYFSLDEAFNVLSYCLKNNSENNNEISPFFNAAFEDKILEFKFFSKGDFFSSTYSWVINNYKELNKNGYYKNILILINKIIKKPEFLINISKLIENSQERKAGIKLYLFMNLLNKKINQIIDLELWDELYVDSFQLRINKEIFREVLTENEFYNETIEITVNYITAGIHGMTAAMKKSNIFEYYNDKFHIVKKWVKIHTHFNSKIEELCSSSDMKTGLNEMLESVK